MFRASEIAMWSKYCIDIWGSFDTTRRPKKLVCCEEISFIYHRLFQKLCLHDNSQNAVFRLQAGEAETLQKNLLLVIIKIS